MQIKDYQWSAIKQNKADRFKSFDWKDTGYESDEEEDSQDGREGDGEGQRE